jgi:hypothetical protein
MSELTRLAQPLLDHPLVPPPSLGELQARNKHRRRRHAVTAGGSAGIIVLSVCLVLALMPTPATTPQNPKSSSSLASFIQKGVEVPDSTLETVGLPSQVTPPNSLAGHEVLTDGGKPAVVYVGAEYCPYCAMQRWALIVALSRFGTFTNLGQTISSSSTDVYPGLQSWSFDGSAYSSPYITFDPAEIYSSTPTVSPESDGYEPLQSLTPLQAVAVGSFDNGEALPFLDIGNQYVAIGSSSSPSVLQGLSLDQIASDLSDPTSPVAQAVDGTANYIVAAICSVVPSGASMCSSSTVTQAQGTMATSPFDPDAP